MAAWLNWEFKEEEFPIGGEVPRHWGWARQKRRRRDGDDDDDEKRRDGDDHDSDDSSNDDDDNDGGNLPDRRWRNGKEIKPDRKEDAKPQHDEDVLPEQGDDDRPQNADQDHSDEHGENEDHELQWAEFKRANMQHGVGRETDMMQKQRTRGAVDEFVVEVKHAEKSKKRQSPNASIQIATQRSWKRARRERGIAL